jgi:hypothetical protein
MERVRELANEIGSLPPPKRRSPALEHSERVYDTHVNRAHEYRYCLHQSAQFHISASFALTVSNHSTILSRVGKKSPLVFATLTEMADDIYQELPFAFRQD